MSDDRPDWLPTVEAAIEPEDQQGAIIDADAYPLRVLAGAGTGKTFTMVRKIERLIDEAGVPPDRILALTFTNNAADSMQVKLHATLGTAGYDVDAYTYHSICSQLLREYAYAADVDPDFDVATDAERYAIVLDVLDEIEYRSVKPNVYDPDSWGSGAASALTTFVGAMKRSGITSADLEAFLESAETLYDLAAITEQVETLASEHLGGRSVGAVLEGLPAVRSGLGAAGEDLDAVGVEGAIADFLGRLEALCETLESAFDSHERGDRDLPEDAHKLPKYLLGGYSSGAPAGIPDDLGLELTDVLRGFLDDCLDARDLTAGYAAYERELADRNLIDFDGLVVETVDLLASDAGAPIADRWDYVFCDEFQDTDRLQFDLVTSLASDERLFVVGDDDQAIYEWRGANVGNITAELDATYGDSLVDMPLAENFRSRQPILDLANAALARLDGRRTDKELVRVDDPDYDGDDVATIDAAEEPDDRAAQLVTVAMNLLSGASDRLDRAYDPGEIAVLVRKHDHATPIIEAFEAAGIPYQVAGDLATESVGVGTVVAYLKALARPETDEVSWNRVLTMRYRLTEADLRRINAHEVSTLGGLLSIPLEEFAEPDRVAEARKHVTELLALRKRVSLAYLYRKLKSITDIEWYLSEQERRDLDQLDELVGPFGEETVQPRLSPEFIESLRHYDALLAEGGSTPTAQPEPATDAVNVMTVHKSKGLDFPVVMVPELSAEEWAPGTRDYDALETAVNDGPDRAFAEDYLARDAREQRRLLHVAMTRAEDILVLQGGDGDDGEPDGNPAERPIDEFLDDVLPAAVPWRPGRGHFPVWGDFQASLPASAVDWTGTLAAEVTGEVGGRITHGDAALSVEAARERALALAGRAIDGAAADGASVETAGSPLAVDALEGPTVSAPAIQHSYTSLEAFETCPRQHYLDFVVNAFPDFDPGDGPTPGSVSQRTVGLLFHHTAEVAAAADASAIEEWYDVVERLASQRRARDALPAAKACIDRYFDLELSDWALLDAERDFELEVDGHDLVGVIDALYRTPADELVVVDYKATTRRRDIEADAQLPIYLLACRELYDEPIRQAGYAYVGEIGPALDVRAFGDDELDEVLSDVTETMDRVGEMGFDSYTDGEHCRWCRHSSLPCAPDTVG